MFDIFLEKPFTISIFAIVLFFIVLYFWAQTRLRWLVYLMAAVVLGGILLVVLERSIQTDREQIRETLTDLASAVADNDKHAVLAYFAEGEQTEPQRMKASGAMDVYTIQRCRVSRFEPFEVPAKTPGQPHRCNLTVFVAGAGEYRGYQGNGASKVTLEMLKDSQDQWKIEDFDFTSPIPKPVGRQ